MAYEYNYRYRIYTGPTLVATVANILSKAYFNVTCQGTEHVYVETNRSKFDLLRTLGPTWRPNDVSVMSRKTQYIGD